MDENKIAFLSGRLTGTKTLKNELNSIKEPDEYEKFLIEYTNLKINITTDNEVIYINDNQDFEENIKNIENSEYMSIRVNDNFTRIYITIDGGKTYIARINKIEPMLFSNLISKEKPIKFSLNAFSFVKWCNEKVVDIRNIYDIPTYIKILTNEIDLDQSLASYIRKYTDKELNKDDIELNNIIIGNFIYEFGKYLEGYIEKFKLANICKLLNDNACFESAKVNMDAECEIEFSYLEMNRVIRDLMSNYIKKFESKAYIISPLGRVALKFGRKEEEIIYEIFSEDLEMLILNELYNNNIQVNLLEDNLYLATCKFKNFSNTVSLLTAILTDVFYTIFDEKVQVKLECILKE